MPSTEDLKSRLMTSRDHPERDQFQKQASVSLVLKRSPQSGLQILFIKRVTHPEDPWSGHMAFPGGHLEIGSERPFEAAVRETQEEVGIDLKQAIFLGELDDFQVHFKGHPVNFIIFPHVFICESENCFEIIPDRSEVADWFWIDLEYFNLKNNMAELPYKLGDNEVTLPSFKFGEERIWGISYLILMDLFQKLHGLKVPTKDGIWHLDSSHWIHYPHYSKSYK